MRPEAYHRGNDFAAFGLIRASKNSGVASKKTLMARGRAATT